MIREKDMVMILEGAHSSCIVVITVVSDELMLVGPSCFKSSFGFPTNS